MQAFLFWCLDIVQMLIQYCLGFGEIVCKHSNMDSMFLVSVYFVILSLFYVSELNSKTTLKSWSQKRKEKKI